MKEPMKNSKQWGDTKLIKKGGSCFEHCDYEEIVKDMEEYITSTIKQAVDEEQKRMTKEMLNNSKPFFDSGYEQADKKWRRRAEMLIQAIKGKSLWERGYIESLASLLEN